MFPIFLMDLLNISVHLERLPAMHHLLAGSNLTQPSKHFSLTVYGVTFFPRMKATKETLSNGMAIISRSLTLAREEASYPTRPSATTFH
jgi:hypothetical protein